MVESLHSIFSGHTHTQPGGASFIFNFNLVPVSESSTAAPASDSVSFCFFVFVVRRERKRRGPTGGGLAREGSKSICTCMHYVVSARVDPNLQTQPLCACL
jgi:hypothetical protein